MNELEILPYFHILVTFYYLYPLIFSKNYFWDKIYLIIVLIVVLNWTVLKGECLLSYIWKKYKDKNYEMGSNTLDINDIKSILSFFDEKFVTGIFALFMLFIILLFGYTANRSKIISFKIIILFIISGIYVLLRERKFFNKKIHKSLKDYYIIYAMNIFTILIITYSLYKVIRA
jgi:hypothetical protein